MARARLYLLQRPAIECLIARRFGESKRSPSRARRETSGARPSRRRRRVVPVREAYELHECLSGTKRLSILNETDHRLSDPALMQRALEESFDWLIRHVR